MSSSKIAFISLSILALSLVGACAIQSKKSDKINKKELCTSLVCRNLTWTDKFKHCGTFIHECGVYTANSIKNQYSLQGFAFQYDPENSGSSTYQADRDAFLNRNSQGVSHQLVTPPQGMKAAEFVELIRKNAKSYKAIAYWPYGPNSNSAADFPLYKSGAKTNETKGALGLHHYHNDSELDEIKNNAIKLFYEYASSKAEDLIKQIKSQIINQGNFKNLTIGHSKTDVIRHLRELQAFYISTQDNIRGEMIDLRKNELNDINRLHASDIWNVTFDEGGKVFWSFQLQFENNSLNTIDVKSSNLELP